MKIKCLCGIEAEYEIENDVVFCNECGTLLLRHEASAGKFGLLSKQGISGSISLDA